LQQNEEKYNHEVKKLRNDLIRANEKVGSLTNQLKNNVSLIVLIVYLTINNVFILYSVLG